MLNITHAISIRQPYVELILTGKKRYEYRSTPTNMRGRVCFMRPRNRLRTTQHGARPERNLATYLRAAYWAQSK